MQQNTSTSPSGFLERNKTMIKGFLIGFLILLMLIPAAFIQNLVGEREGRQQEVIGEISAKWAAPQTITGPLLIIPYKEYQRNKDGNLLEYRKEIYLLPDMLDIRSSLQPEIRHRSLYDVTLYRSVSALSGQFDATALKKMNINPDHILWNECHLLLGIDDARGLEDEIGLRWNGKSMALEAGFPENNALTSGLSTPLTLDPQRPVSFSMDIKLKGSGFFYFTPVGKTTTVSLTAPWNNPAFDGQYLPQRSAITDQGFKASWKVLQVSRNYPQYWSEGKYDLKGSSFGVKLLQPTDSYAKTSRSVKYAILFIALTFTVFFFLEILQKQQIHPLQYILVGLALCIFYTLLLSISEYTGFNPAYIIAAFATVTLIGLYVWSIFRKPKIALGFIGALTGLYTYIFILIQLQDYALLFGSMGLFVIVAILMYYSRKIDWYNQGKNTGATLPEGR